MSETRKTDVTAEPTLSKAKGVEPTEMASPQRDRLTFVDWLAWPLHRLFAYGANTIHSQFHRLDIFPDSEDGPEA